jgi:predicted transcriptional regulator
VAGHDRLLELTAGIVGAHVAGNKVAVADVASLVEHAYRALSSAVAPTEAPAPKSGIVSVRASVRPDYLVCLSCGSRQKMLSRHLRLAHGLTPAEYRADYGLSETYPMTAPSYSQLRRDLARSFGLGKPRRPRRSPGAGEAQPPR